MGELALELAGSIRTVILLIASAAVTLNIGLTSYYMFRKSVNEASV
jgi:hypothetical protein